MEDSLDFPTPEEVVYAAEQCLPYLRADLQAGLRSLLARARQGQKVDNTIVALFAEDEAARRWLSQALFGPQAAQLMGNYDPLAGPPTPVPASSQWRCPQHPEFEWRVGRAGRPVPPCPKCGSPLFRVNP